MIRLPMLAFMYGMEIFVKTMHGFQRIADQSVDALTAPPGPAAGPQAVVAASGQEHPPGNPTVSTGVTSPQTPNVISKEHNKMPDTNLSDDMLKLVRFKVLFVKRDYEVAFPEQEELVYDNMTDTAFTAWKVAEFIQSLDETNVPQKWLRKQYPPHRQEVHGRWFIHSLPEDDKKYLRVYFEVMQRYAREKFKGDERKVEELENIRRILDDRLQPAGAGGGGAAGGAGAGGGGAAGGGGGRGGAGGGQRNPQSAE
jgi:hypothetical protein